MSPLDLQMGVANPRDVPEGVEDALFGGDQATYAVIDAARLITFEPDYLDGIQCASLFNGAAAQDLHDCAPYLVQLSPDNGLTQALFTQADHDWAYWSRDAFILLRSAAAFEDVRDHLRRFTKIPDANGDWFFLRFAMPQTMETVMRVLAGSPQHLIRWFVSSKGAHVVDRFIVPDRAANALHVHTVKADELLSLGQPPARYMLDTTYQHILHIIREDQLVVRISGAIRHDYNDLFELGDAGIDALVRDSLKLGRSHGIRTEMGFGQLAAAGLLIGKPLTSQHLERVAGFNDPAANANQRTAAVLTFAENHARRTMAAQHYDETPRKHAV